MNDAPWPVQDPQRATLALLAHAPLFAAVSPPALKTLAAGSTLRRYERDAFLFRAGEHPEYLHVLAHGSIQLSAGTPDGREAVVELLRPFETCILAAVLTSQPYLMSARAVEPSHVLEIPARLLLGEMRSDPELALALLGAMAQQYRRLVREIKDLRLRTASQRLARYLLRLMESEGDGQGVRLPVEKKLLASRLGMTPEHLSRAVVELRRHGIDLRGDDVRVTDLAELRAFCHLDQLLDSLERDLRVMLPAEE